MRNPYEVLEINQGATEEDIKTAYKKLAKKYHPDKYINNPLADLAEEKFKEVSEAYNYLLKNGTNGSSSSYSSGSNYQNTYQGSQSSSNQEFQKVRQYINSRNINEAERILDQIRDRNAEWNYLKGVIALRKNWYTQGYSYIQNAVNMDPSNVEYRNALNQLKMQQGGYRTTSTNRGYGNDAMCNLCTNLICADCLCECLGGDLISCC